MHLGHIFKTSSTHCWMQWMHIKYLLKNEWMNECTRLIYRTFLTLLGRPTAEFPKRSLDYIQSFNSSKLPLESHHHHHYPLFNVCRQWIFIGRIDVEAEALMLWPPDVKSWLIIGKDPDAGKDWRQEEKGETENEMVGWHHQLNGYEFEQIPGANEWQESLACCSPWGHKESGTT